MMCSGRRRVVMRSDGCVMMHRHRGVVHCELFSVACALRVVALESAVRLIVNKRRLLNYVNTFLSTEEFRQHEYIIEKHSHWATQAYSA
jgi:hypothetical protein